MGLLRTLFALSVVLAHSSPIGVSLIGGQNAVQLFYIISGFLISFIWVEKKSYKNIISFWLNRYLRLYPIYLVIAILSLIAMYLLKSASFWNTYAQAPIQANLLLIFSNIFIIGQDLAMFTAIKNHILIFTRDFTESDIRMHAGLLMPQAWSLSVEIYFYLIAPFILKNRKLIILLIIVSAILRGYLINLGIGNKDPWSYRFFPTELALFLLGSLSHQILLPLYQKISSKEQIIVSNIATYFLICFSLFYKDIPLDEITKKSILFISFILLLPLTFIFQNKNNIDKEIGRVLSK